MARSAGHCMTMGTASTMASVAEALGMQLSGSASWPAVDARRYEIAQAAGQRHRRDGRRGPAAQPGHDPRGVRERHPHGRGHRRVHERDHPPAGDRRTARRPAGARGLRHPRVRRCRPSSTCMPSGRFLMEDFCYAGGLPVVLRELSVAGLLHDDALTVSGQSIGKDVAAAECWNRDVIRTVDEPLQQAGSTAVLRGNLAPGGAVIKQSAASPAPARAPRPGRGLRLPGGLPPPGGRADLSARRRHRRARGGPQGATPACRRSPTSRCRPSCCGPASPTWCASRTAG